MAKNHKKYYIHRMLKKAGFNYNSKTNQIFASIDASPDNKYLKRAQQELNYSVQYIIQ